MKKVISTFVLSLLFSVPIYTLAQVPQYYNTNGGTGINTYPWGQAGGQRVHWLIRPNELNQPGPCPAGNITTLFFFMGNTASGTFTNLIVRLGQTALTSLPANWYAGSMDTVYFRASGSLSCTNSQWMMITLDRPFAYNPAQSLIIDVSQCAATGLLYVRQSSVSPATRNYGTPGGGCNIVYAGQDGQQINFGVNIVQPPPLPDLIYYKFENNPSATTVLNCAIPGVGNNPATLTPPPTLGSGGQFDTCLVGTGGTGAVFSGWNCNLANNRWTISFWVQNLVDLNPTYLFGDVGSTSFRCFYGGAALANNILLRGPMTDILIPCPMPGTFTFHFVYDSVNVLIYRNGALISTNPRAINMPTGTGFRVGGYNNTASSLSGKMDEFRIYRRALDTAEISATWNTDIGGCTGPVGIGNNNNQIPGSYELKQNFPNPFNPSTKIAYALPKSGNVSLVVFDLLGREVAVLVNGYKKAGSYDVDFNASALSSGVYFYRINAGEFKDTKKMLLIK
jgi:concanavalin A-like lectin/glucanase superfamily protein/type IX secretion system substrate protein